VQIPAVTEPAWASLVSVNRDGSDGVTHALRGEFVELGSSEPSALRFDDPHLAPCHARIERQGSSGARIVPVDRLNGVFRRLRQDTRLADGAIVLLGRELIRFELLGPEESKPKALLQHGVTRFGSPLREAWGRISQILPSGGIRDVRHLHGEEMVVGREEGDLVFSDDEFLSRRHAAFRWQHGQCVLSDLGSSNGTFLRIVEPSNLSDGDFLRIGDQMFRYKPEV
jgi:pSer/pThr/pTyr-binding forkhead associated (FHA) protein